MPASGAALNLFCPYADLANHSVLGPNCTFGIATAPDSGLGASGHVQHAASVQPSAGAAQAGCGSGWRFVLRLLATAGALAQGSEVLVSYGQLDNRQLVSRCGPV